MSATKSEAPPPAPPAGLRALSVLLGIFMFAMGWSKTAWLTSSALLTDELWGWHEYAPAVSQWYLETIAIPGAPLFARLVLLGELACGTALMLGLRIRLAALVSLLMVLNFHFAMGVLFQAAYLTNGYGLPVVAGLTALAWGGGGLPYSLTRRA